MALSFPRLGGLLGLALLAMPMQAADCNGVPAWSATTTYASGTKVVYQGGLYTAIVSTTNVQPNYCAACGWWKFEGDCGSVTPTPTPTATPTPTPTVKPTPTPTPTPTATPSGCNGISSYVPGTVYVGGNQVLYNGQIFKAKWWTQNETPSTGGSGVWQLMGDCVTCTSVASVPTGLGSSNVTFSTASLSWNASSAASGCTVSYKIFQNGAQIATSTSTNFNVTGLAASTSYTFTVASVDAAGTSSQSAAISVKTPAQPLCAAVPSVPTGLTSPGQTSSSISLVWNASSADSSCSITYNVYQNGTKILTVPSTSAVVSGLSANTSYTFTVSAVDSVGASAQSSSVSVKTSSNVVVNLPKRIMSGYWHTWAGGPGFIKLRDVDTNWDVINISFSEPVTPGSTDGRMKFVVSGDASYSDADFKADIKALQAKGKKIVLSIGGYEGYFSLGNSAAVSTFVSAINGFVDAYGFDGIDMDLEQSSVQMNSGADPDFKNPTSPRIVNLISAIRQICDAHGSKFILSWAPETFYLQMGYQYYAGLNGYVDARAGSYIPMIHALRDKTTYVQAQLYNSGAILAPNGGYYSMGDEASLIAMCDMLLKGFNVNNNANYFFPPLRPDQVVIGVPASGSAAGSGQVPNATLQHAFTTLNSTYPGLRGIMTWSINWDKFQNNNGFVDGNRAFLNTLP